MATSAYDELWSFGELTAQAMRSRFGISTSMPFNYMYNYLVSIPTIPMGLFKYKCIDGASQSIVVNNNLLFNSLTTQLNKFPSLASRQLYTVLSNCGNDPIPDELHELTLLSNYIGSFNFYLHNLSYLDIPHVSSLNQYIQKSPNYSNDSILINAPQLNMFVYTSDVMISYSPATTCKNIKVAHFNQGTILTTLQFENTIHYCKGIYGISQFNISLIYNKDWDFRSISKPMSVEWNIRSGNWYINELSDFTANIISFSSYTCIHPLCPYTNTIYYNCSSSDSALYCPTDPWMRYTTESQSIWSVGTIHFNGNKIGNVGWLAHSAWNVENIYLPNVISMVEGYDHSLIRYTSNWFNSYLKVFSAPNLKYLDGCLNFGGSELYLSQLVSMKAINGTSNLKKVYLGRTRLSSKYSQEPSYGFYFYNCPNLSYIYIHNWDMEYCWYLLGKFEMNDLQTLIIDGHCPGSNDTSSAPSYPDQIISYFSSFTNLRIYVPYEYITDYQYRPGWSYFASRIYDIRSAPAYSEV